MVFQAFYSGDVVHFTILRIIISVTATSATVVALMMAAPNIQNRIAVKTIIASTISFRDTGPSLSTRWQPIWHFITLLDFRRIDPVDQKRQQEQHHYSKGAEATNQSVQEMSILVIFLMISIHSRLGARAVRNMELVTPVVAKATHIT